MKSAEPHSIFIFHACAHNPTGCDPSKAQWEQIGQISKDRKLFPLFDAAYLGFNSGDVDEDAFAIRYFIDVLKLETAVCMSFAKNMGLYGTSTVLHPVVILFADIYRRAGRVHSLDLEELIGRTEH